MLAHASLLARSVYAITAVDSGLTGETVVVGYPSPRLNAYRSWMSRPTTGRRSIA